MQKVTLSCLKAGGLLLFGVAAIVLTLFAVSEAAWAQTLPKNIPGLNNLGGGDVFSQITKKSQEAVNNLTTIAQVFIVGGCIIYACMLAFSGNPNPRRAAILIAAAAIASMAGEAVKWVMGN